jgi:hypothetical protein
MFYVSGRMAGSDWRDDDDERDAEDASTKRFYIEMDIDIHQQMRRKTRPSPGGE